MSDKILVLGVGNLLLSDEGLGVHAVRALQEDPRLPMEVTVVDGGTLGPRLLDFVLGCDRLVLIDVAKFGAAPGTMFRLEGNQVRQRLRDKQSAHDWGILEVLAQAELVGHRPDTVIIAAEPLDIRTFSTELTPPLASALPTIVTAVLRELGAIPDQA
jgi:hydrogenase maturation protease